MTAVSFRVDEFMQTRITALKSFMHESADGDVDVKTLKAAIRNARDLARRLERQLPKKLRTHEVERFAVWYWTPYELGGGKQQFLASFATKEEAINYALETITEDYPGLQYAKIVDATDHSTTDIVSYPSLSARPQNGTCGELQPGSSARDAHEEGTDGRRTGECRHVVAGAGPGENGEPVPDRPPQTADDGIATGPESSGPEHPANSGQYRG